MGTVTVINEHYTIKMDKQKCDWITEEELECFSEPEIRRKLLIHFVRANILLKFHKLK